METHQNETDESTEIDSLLKTLKDWAEGRPQTETSIFVEQIVATLKKEGMLQLQLADDNREVTPKVAGELLGVSRPHVYKLLDRGAIPFRYVGKHRRILLTDIVEYRSSLEESRRELAEVFGNAAADKEALIEQRAQTLRKNAIR